MQRVRKFVAEFFDVERGFPMSAAGGVAGLSPQRPPFQFVVGHSFADQLADVPTAPVGDSPATSFNIHDPPNNLPHILDVRVGSSLEHQELPGHGEAQSAALHVLQDGVGEFQDPKVVGQRGPVHAQLLGKRLHGEFRLVYSPLVGPHNFDLAQLLATFVFRQRHHRHHFVADLRDIHVDVRLTAALLVQQPATRDHAMAKRGLDPPARGRGTTSQRRLQETQLVDAFRELCHRVWFDFLPRLPGVVVDQVQGDPFSGFHFVQSSVESQ